MAGTLIIKSGFWSGPGWDWIIQNEYGDSMFGQFKEVPYTYTKKGRWGREEIVKSSRWIGEARNIPAGNYILDVCRTGSKPTGEYRRIITVFDGQETTVQAA